MNVIDDEKLQASLIAVEKSTLENLPPTVQAIVPIVAALLDAQRTAFFAALKEFRDETLAEIKSLKVGITG